MPTHDKYPLSFKINISDLHFISAKQCLAFMKNVIKKIIMELFFFSDTNFMLSVNLIILFDYAFIK